VAGVTLGAILSGTLGGGTADAAPIMPGLPAIHGGVSNPSKAQGSSVAPLSSGWIVTFDTSFFNLSTPPNPTIGSGPTGSGGTTGLNVLRASMTGSKGTYNVQVAIPVGQTIQTNRLYTSNADSASVVASWPGGGCASQGLGSIDQFTVNQLTRNGGGATTAYAVQFACYSTVAFVQGAFANNVVPTTPHQGYYTYGSDGTISGFGNDSYLTCLGTLAATVLNAPIVGMATTPDGGGYWMVASDGGVFGYGDAGFYGSMGAKPLNQPITGMATTSDGKGYWMVATDGGIFAFGDAGFHGSMGGTPLNQSIVGMTPSPGGGYRMVAADGGIFAFGGAPFYGSMGGLPLNQPIVGMTDTPDGGGYWMVATDGGIFSFGDAAFWGSTGAIPLNNPVVGMNATADGKGYWLVRGDGGSSPSEMPPSSEAWAVSDTATWSASPPEPRSPTSDRTASWIGEDRGSDSTRPLGIGRSFAGGEVVVVGNVLLAKHPRQSFTHPVSPAVLDDPQRLLAVLGPHGHVGHELGGGRPRAPPSAHATEPQALGHEDLALGPAHLALLDVDARDIAQGEPMGEPQLPEPDSAVPDPQMDSVAAERPMATPVVAAHGEADVNGVAIGVRRPTVVHRHCLARLRAPYGCSFPSAAPVDMAIGSGGAVPVRTRWPRSACSTRCRLRNRRIRRPRS